MGHLSFEYLKKSQDKYPGIQDLKESKFNESIRKCEICLISKLNKLPFRTSRIRADRLLQIIHSDVMGKINPSSHPKGYKYILVFIDNFVSPKDLIKQNNKRFERLCMTRNYLKKKCGT